MPRSQEDIDDEAREEFWESNRWWILMLIGYVIGYWVRSKT